MAAISAAVQIRVALAARILTAEATRERMSSSAFETAEWLIRTEIHTTPRENALAPGLPPGRPPPPV
jgi:hypothetical protein